ncbi:hypothetical protein GVX76_08150 [[Haemophilus] felis]|nr:hypothetical protein [[Haemophilus] felis]
MLVKNVEPRLIRIGGEFIAPNQTMEIADDAVGLQAFLDRGVLVKVEEPKAQNGKGNKKEG